MPERLTLVTCYYRQPVMLREQIRTIESYPPELAQRLKIIIVDDGSPEPAEVPATLACEVELYRILEDRPWHHIGARNLGMHVAPEGWCAQIDIDHTIPRETIEALFAHDLDERRYYLFGRRVKAPHDEPHHPHPDSRIITRRMFWDVGGGNEDLVGIYGGGNELPARLRKRFGLGVPLPVALRVYNLAGVDLDPSVPGAGAPLPRKGSEYHGKSNRALRRKLDSCYLATPKDHLRFPWTRVL
jgi:hypothetical protein